MEWNAYNVGDENIDDHPAPADGGTTVLEGKLERYGNALYSSETVWGAAKMGHGTTIYRVHCGGEVIRDDGMVMCTERTVIARIEAASILREYRREYVRAALPFWLDCADKTCWEIPDVVWEYIRTGDENTKRAASDAAAEFGGDYRQCSMMGMFNEVGPTILPRIQDQAKRSMAISKATAAFAAWMLGVDVDEAFMLAKTCYLPSSAPVKVALERAVNKAFDELEKDDD